MVCERNHGPVTHVGIDTGFVACRSAEDTIIAVAIVLRQPLNVVL